MDLNGIIVASSARSEEYFNEVKNLIFAGRKNIRADKFLISHIRSLAGTMNILNADVTISVNENHEIPILNSNQNNVCITHQIRI